MRRFLIWLSGAQAEILAECPTDRGKYEGIGSAVLITACMAAISMVFALNTALNVPLPLALGAGMLWGLAIMSLDRWLVGSIQGQEKAWKNIMTAVPRLLLALLFGIVISHPLVLQIFRPEIEAQISQIQRAESDKFLAEQQRGNVGKEITQRQREVDGLQKVITSRGTDSIDPNTDPKVRGLTVQRDDQQKTVDALYAEWRCQLDGSYNGRTCNAGQGPLANATKKKHDQAQARLSSLNRQIEDRKKELTAGDRNSRATRLDYARKELPKAQERLTALRDQQQAAQTAFEAKNKASTGLLIRLKALDEVAKTNDTLNSARLILLAFIMAIECLPIIVKLMQTFGPPSNYDKIRKIKENAQMRVAEEHIKQDQMDKILGGQESIEKIWDDPVPPPRPPRPTTPLHEDPWAGDGQSAPFSAQGPHDPWEDDRLRRMTDQFESEPRSSAPRDPRDVPPPNGAPVGGTDTGALDDDLDLGSPWHRPSDEWRN
ncbi:DUF4407 domain-containing protein [Actinomadura craniellae]|uniref:DUF4407 domain-containing protein n=1 Tax=Actinomadura craniellae TaxID=2231787 RepID=UPI001313DF71|nr:DUF4407 domain-containing protein [Actinomadura craniellae]